MGIKKHTFVFNVNAIYRKCAPPFQKTFFTGPHSAEYDRPRQKFTENDYLNWDGEEDEDIFADDDYDMYID